MNESIRFGRYEVKRVLGEGQMGIVYLAKDPLIGRPVAIKAIRENSGQHSGGFAECRARFEREIQIAGTFAHPNIVTIYDVGLEQGQSFVAMEFVEGGNLADLLCRESTLPFAKVIDLIEQIGSALDYAHARGVVHRDVKPSNILLTFDGRPKITDFGVARLSDSTLTRRGATYGSPAYMSPEQAASRAISGTSDQFSLAILTYRMLTGELPFAGDSINAVMYRIVKEEPVPPGLLNPLLPDEASTVLLRALSKNPLDRHPSCRELAAKLKEALESAAAAETASLRQDAFTAKVSDLESAVERGRQDSVDHDVPESGAIGWLAKGFLATMTGMRCRPLSATVATGNESRGWQYLTAAVLMVLAVLVGANVLRSDSVGSHRPRGEQVLNVLQKEAPRSQQAIESALLSLPTSDKGEGEEDGATLALLGEPAGLLPGERVAPGGAMENGRTTEPSPRSARPAEPPASANAGRSWEGLSEEWDVVPAGSIPLELGRRGYSSAAAFRTIINSLEPGAAADLFQETTCVAVLPGVVKVGLVFGGRSGKGLMSCRTDQGWSRPAFVSMSGGSVGLQIGAQATDFVLLFSSTMAIDRLSRGALELGIEATSVATGPVDNHALAVAQLGNRPEVYSYSLSRGLFAGISLDGSTLLLDRSSNSEVYAGRLTGHELLTSHGGELPRELASLLEELSHYGQ